MNWINLNNGNKIPSIGFGTYQATEQEGIEAVKAALRNGYRLIDTAAKYENEVAVGKAIRESGIPREEIVVTTKVWRDQLGFQNTKKAFEESINKLNLDYLDLYLIHWPANAKNFENWEEVNAETWRALEELQLEGKVKSIGVSNFWMDELQPLLNSAKIKPAINQVEFHPGFWQPELLTFCKENNIVLEAWSPLARGRIFQNQTLKNIAENHGKSISQVTLRWILQHGVVPIPKSNSVERIIENISIFDFELSEDEMKLINELPPMGFSGELPSLWPERIPME